MNVLKCFSVLFLVFGIKAAVANSEKGKELYMKNCQSCHGDQAQGTIKEEAPRLAGQHDWYIIDQLKAFKAGVRSNPKMLPFIKNLSNNDFSDLAAYLKSLKTPQS